MLSIFCLVFLAISIAILATGISLSLRSHKKAGGEQAILSPFHILLIGFFAAAVVIFLPVVYSDGFDGEAPFLRVIKTASFSIISAVRVFLVDCDIEIIENVVTDTTRVHPVIGGFYSVYSALIFVFGPVLTAGFVLSFFKNASAYLKYFTVRNGEIYYISELNDKSFELAKNIINETSDTRRKIVFFGVKIGEDADNPLIDEARKLGAICFSKDITEMNFKPHCKNLSRKFYLLSLNEDKNVKSALSLIDSCRRDEEINTEKTAFYVFATNEGSEVMLDSADNGNMTVRRVNENRNLVLHTLIDEPGIFSDYIDRDGLKVINALIVGGGKCGVEFMKSLCWCGQLPDYQINIHLVDKDEKLEDKLHAKYTEMIDRSGVYEYGESYYKLDIHSGIDVNSKKFVDLLDEIGSVSVVFVTLGDDNVNIATSMNLRREIGRLNIKKQYKIPTIYTVVYGSEKNDIVKASGGLKCLGEDDFGIKFIGDIRDRYSPVVIEQAELETIGREIHLSWLNHEKEIIRKNHEDEQKINEKIEKSRLAYHKYEYFRRASIANAVHIKVIENLKITFPDGDARSLNEHNRWNAFMRSEGYLFDQNIKDHLIRTHTDLKRYKGLNKKTQEKDNISAEVTEKIKRG